MIEINFINNYNAKYDNYYELYCNLAQKTLNYLNKKDDYVISVSFVTNTDIHKINKDYRNKDNVTDVISFENDTTLIDGVYDLGDIFISVDKAIEQANEYKHSITRELSFLFVHGLLHCLGYDHMDKKAEKEMFNLQEVILGE